MSDKMRGEALDVEFHWVNESGELAELTGGMSLKPTVCMGTNIVAPNYRTWILDYLWSSSPPFPIPYLVFENPHPLQDLIHYIQDTFATCPPLDIALMGAHDSGYTLSDGETAYIRKVFSECAAFITICGGSLSALQAGIMAGKTATAPRPFVDFLRKSNPEVNWVVKRWVRDGKLWTSGALLNGLDLMAAFVDEFWGAKNYAKGSGLGDGKDDGEEVQVQLDDSLVEFALRLGAFPRRDVDYKDVPWAI